MQNSTNMRTHEDFERLESELQKLVGETCDMIFYTSPSTIPPDHPNYKQPYATHITTEGEVRAIPFLQLIFSEESRVTRGHYYRLGLLGTWHILKNAKSICSYVGAYDSDGKMLQHLQLIENHHVKRVVFIQENLNLFLEFDHNLWLGVFHASNSSSGFTYYDDTWHGSALSGGGIHWTIFDGNITWEFLTS